MKKIFPLIALLCSLLRANAQVQPYGIVDTADLKLKSCDFEKDANAEVLYEKIYVYYKYSTVVMEYHKRIKIFNDKGNDFAKGHIEYYGAHKDEAVADLQAETINLTNGKIEFTPVDKASIFAQDVDKQIKAINFTFPNIKAGSIVEYKYKWSSPYAANVPDWILQGEIPVRHTEFKGEFSPDYDFNIIKRVNQKFRTDTNYFTNGKNVNKGLTRIWAVDSVHSLKDEPLMNAEEDNIEHILFQVTGYWATSWSSLVRALMKDVDFGNELDTRIFLNKEDDILTKIASFETADEKVNYVYNLVKSSMKYNGYTSFFTDAEIKRAWARKEGNAAEINFIIYHFLKRSGMDVRLLLLNTHHKIEQDYTSLSQMNRVALLVLTAGKQYVLDAANADGRYDEIPYYALNSNALLIDPTNSTSDFVTLENHRQLQESVFINAEITPDAKMTGTTQINSTSYLKSAVMKKYKKEGEKKYIDYLRDDNNELKITSLKIDSTKADSLPLTQNIDFSLGLPGSDEHYIYFSPNLFTSIGANPFLSEERFSDIDFKYLTALTISGRYKIPTGFKVDALPKSQAVVMPDRSIVFKRIVQEDEGYVVVNYKIDFARSYYEKDEYKTLREFYKKMFNMINEQIVLKKQG